MRLQRLIVLPGLDLVVTLFAGRYNDTQTRWHWPVASCASR
jgi:hypothetical protein